jgi:16S rRNA (uracil1498-N3)-methyltransferase
MKHRPHLLVDADWDGDFVAVGEPAAAHLTKVLRYQKGGLVSYTDGAGRLGEGIWTGVGVERGSEQLVDRPSTLTIAVAPPRPKDRQRFIVEKSQELGVSKLVWLTTDLSEGRAPSIAKAAAWRSAALEQSRGAWLTELEGPISLGALSHPILCDLDGGSFRDIVKSHPLTIAIGPEGGWSPAEIESCQSTVSIASTVLRTETAAVVAATMVLQGGCGSDTIALSG